MLAPTCSYLAAIPAITRDWLHLLLPALLEVHQEVRQYGQLLLVSHLNSAVNVVLGRVSKQFCQSSCLIGNTMTLVAAVLVCHQTFDELQSYSCDDVV